MHSNAQFPRVKRELRFKPAMRTCDTVFYLASPIQGISAKASINSERFGIFLVRSMSRWLWQNHELNDP